MAWLQRLPVNKDNLLATSAWVRPRSWRARVNHPDVEELDPAGHRDTLVEQKLGSAFFAQAGLPSPVPVGSFLDLFPVSVLTTSTLDQLHDVRPESRFDERRFRMNVIVSTPQKGFVEHDWVGRGLEVGDGVRLRVTMPDPRCVMTTLAQDDLPQDTEILRTLSRHNRVPVGGAGHFPCAGVPWSKRRACCGQGNLWSFIEVHPSRTPVPKETEEDLVVKLTVLFGPPTDAAAFEDYYANTHLPLVAKVPGILSHERTKVIATPDGSEPPYYRVWEGWYENADQLQASFASPEGQAAAGDLQNFATGGVILLISDVEQ